MDSTLGFIAKPFICLSRQNKGQLKHDSRLRLAALLLLAVCALSSPLPAQSKSRHSAQRKGWELVWHDEFNGRALSDEWTRIPRFPNPSEWNKYMSTDDRLFPLWPHQRLPAPGYCPFPDRRRLHPWQKTLPAGTDRHPPAHGRCIGCLACCLAPARGTLASRWRD